ncbi:MAG: primosomal protein N' [Clostridium sp.]|nr:primosomal protein N' [Clostridium sp.]
MSPRYADIIIDISHEAIDRTFQYRIPENLAAKIRIGTQVSIPFGRGNRLRSGYVVAFSETPAFEELKIKEIAGIREGGVAAQDSLIELAAFIKEKYGSTMINALKTVMPVKDKVKGLVRRQVRLLLSDEEAKQQLSVYQKRNARAKLRLLTELLEGSVIPYGLVTGKLNISAATLKAMQEEQVIVVEEEGYYRNVVRGEAAGWIVVPNEEQQAVIDKVVREYQCGNPGTYLLKGVTGSGKTLVYIEIIDRIVSMGREAIVLIPEIALTYQTVKRFRQRFGNRVTIMNSRLSKGERYDQFEKAKNGDVSVIIGPRSALFAPFQHLGIIVIDEEHEAAYKSEYPPKYHAREVAIERARMAGALVVLGSATPSVESYYHALQGDYELLTLSRRASEEAELAEVSVVDLRRELKSGNRSIFSRKLQELMADRLEKKQQIMLFLNRRGFSGFISCRSCGHVFKCPHCDVSLTEHFSGTPREKLVCHYCGYEQKKPAVCPECQSKYIAGFGIGTQKVEEQVKVLFPTARVLRMDMDTTRNKDAHEKILSQFADKEADILVGTQMIVKGHDFSNVTLVGVIAADLTLFDNDYKSAERTFDLLTQAAGRAGRGSLKGDVVIQTYNPEHYVIETAAMQDYQAFYREEKAYRSLLAYPPFCHVLAVFMEHDRYEELCRLSAILKGIFDGDNPVRSIGPCDATIAKVNDRYRRVIYLKHEEYDRLVEAKNKAERYLEGNAEFKDCHVSFDFDPVHGY